MSPIVKPVTLADFTRENRLVERGCSACGKVEYPQPVVLSAVLDVEVSTMRQWRKCRFSGAHNTDLNKPAWVRPDSCEQAEIPIPKPPGKRR